MSHQWVIKWSAAADGGKVGGPLSKQPGDQSMYCPFFGLQEKPFSITPDPRFPVSQSVPSRGARALIIWD